MKRLLSIIFIAVVVLHALGYYCVFVGMHYQNDRTMTKALEAGDYDPTYAVTIKVGVSIPYMPDQADYQRVEGKFQHQGELYRMVKQRYAKDTLTIICVRDSEHKKIEQQLANYVTSFAETATSGKSTTKVTIGFLKDYLPVAFSLGSLSMGWKSKVILSTFFATLIPSFSASITHPPQKAWTKL